MLSISNILLCLISAVFSFGFYWRSCAQELKPHNFPGEYLLNPEVNSALMFKQEPAFLRSADGIIIYITDTVELPFLDDFSVSKVKKYNPDVTLPNVIHIEKSDFLVDGIYLDSIEVMNDTSYYYSFNGSTQQYDTFPNQFYTIIFYRNSDLLDTATLILPTDTVVAWPNITYRFNAFSTDTIVLPRDTVYFNSRSTFHYVPDDNISLWVDSFAYINNSYAVNPPTIGVATFDGVDDEGMPYDFTLPETYGVADFLTSKPINLAYTASDSVVLSFYYQPQGLGDFPDAQDSLVLEFYSPSAGNWFWVWSAKGTALANFQRVAFPITDSKFLQKGFRLRFKNYATLSGLFDHWNVDYVYIDKNRNVNQSAVNDFGYVSIGPSFVKTYTSIPLQHYKEKTQETISDYKIKLTNLSSAAVQNNLNRYDVYDENETVLEFASNNDNLVASFAPLSEALLNHTVNKLPGNGYRFLPAAGDRKTFKIKLSSTQSTFGSGTEINPFNDTVLHYQVFDTYYAYDDGSAEKTYALVGLGAQLAYKFTVLKDDTLKGVYMYFPYLLNDVQQFSFNIMVWADSNGFPGPVIYKGNFVNPVYSERINRYVRYKIDTPFVLGGTFYIGWQQIGADKIYLGFDKNINNQSKIFYKTGTNWNNTQFEGSLMIRPDFGEPPAIVSVAAVEKSDPEILVYPNPASDRIYLDFGYENQEEKLQIFIYDVYGRIVLRERLNVENYADVSVLPAGIYFLQPVNDSGKTFPVKKILISR